MKKFPAVIYSVLLSLLVISVACGGQIIQYNEKMVGAGHPTLADTLNRGFLTEHDSNGGHSNITPNNVTVDNAITLGGVARTTWPTSDTVTTSLPWDNITGTTAIKSVAVTYVIDGGGSAITTGEKGHLLVPFAGTITKVYAFADQTGSIAVSIWKDSYANYPPTSSDNITASAPVTLTNAVKSFDNTLTGWTTSIAEGDILAYNVDSASTIQRVTISLVVEK